MKFLSSIFLVTSLFFGVTHLSADEIIEKPPAPIESEPKLIPYLSSLVFAPGSGISYRMYKESSIKEINVGINYGSTTKGVFLLTSYGYYQKTNLPTEGKFLYYGGGFGFSALSYDNQSLRNVLNVDGIDDGRSLILPIPTFPLAVGIESESGFLEIGVDFFVLIPIPKIRAGITF